MNPCTIQKARLVMSLRKTDTLISRCLGQLRELGMEKEPLFESLERASSAIEQFNP